MEHTNNGVSGAIIAPNLPAMEQKFIIVLRKFVGHNSAVNMYNTANAHVIEHFPIINNIKIIEFFSCGNNDELIVATPLVINAKHSNVRRPTRFRRKHAIKIPGISAATTVMKLKYLF